MNSIITFPPPEPELKLARPSAEKWAATLTEERRRLHEDHEALREREANLRDYEARLRALQAEIDASRRSGVASAPAFHAIAPGLSWTPTHAPATDDKGLQAAWEKLHRARELSEAEQRNMRDDRIALREQEVQLKCREAALRTREERLAEREALVTAALPPVEPMTGEPTLSAVTKFTRGPFNMARSVFGGKRD